MQKASQKKRRLVALVSPDTKELAQIAAGLSGVTLSELIIGAVTEKAQAVMDGECRIRLTTEGAKSVFKALAEPPQLNQKLLGAAQMARFRKIT